MADEPDPRWEFSARMSALLKATGMSLRELERASAETPRRGGRPPRRLSSSTAGGMVTINPVRGPSTPTPERMQVFVDTCIRWAGEAGVELPDDLGSVTAWDDAYHEMLAKVVAWRSGRARAEALKFLRQIAQASAEDPDETADLAQPCPYPGLATFGSGDAQFFFGRENLIESLLQRVRGEHAGSALIMVTGPSGSGKSSLLRAGLAAALSGDRPGATLSECPPVPFTVFTPGSDPTAALAEAIAAMAGLRSAEELPGQGDAASPERLRAALAGCGRVVIIVDQFEELFTSDATEEQRQLFVRALAALCGGTDADPAPAVVILGMRADFFGHCTVHPPLTAALENPVVVGPMTGAQLRKAVEEPAALVGLRLQDGLVDLLMEDLQARDPEATPGMVGALPLLAYALFATWRQRRRGELTLVGYLAAGGATGALRHAADTLVDELDPDGIQEARRILLRLVRLGRGTDDTRRSAPLSELLPAPSDSGYAATRRVLDRLARERLVTVTEHVAELTHEVLIDAWPQLRQWIDADRAELLALQQLRADAEEWDRNGRDNAYLYRGSRWAAIAPLRQRTPGPAAMTQAFLQASGFAVRRTAWMRRSAITALAGALVIAVIAAAAALSSARDADRERATAQSRQLAAQSETLRSTDFVTSALLAAAAWRTARTPEARFSMITALSHPERGLLTGHDDLVWSVAYSPDGRLLATASEDGTVRMWDLGTREQIGEPLFKGGSVSSVAFSPDGRTLAAAGADKMIKLWDVGTRRPLDVDFRHTGHISSVAFSPDGKTLASSGYDGKVRLWDLATRRLAGSLTFPGTVYSVQYSPDGRTFTTAAEEKGNAYTVKVWDAGTRRQRGATYNGMTGSTSIAEFSPDGTMIATDAYGGTVLWDWAAGRKIATLPEVSQPEFSPDGRTLATSTGDGVQLWDVATRSPLGGPLTGHGNSVTALAFSPDGADLASGSADDTVRLWDVATRRPIGARFTGRSLWAARLSSDGTILAAAEQDRTVRLWTVATHAALGNPLVPHGAPDNVAFSPDGATLASAGDDGRVELWDVATGRNLGVLTLPAAGAAWGVSFSLDGKTLAAGGENGIVQLWDVATHRTLRTLTGHTSWVRSVAFSPDGTELVTASEDETVRVWDVATGSLRATLTGHTAGVWAARFSPDGTTIATAAWDHTVRLWDAVSYRQLGTPLTGHTNYVNDVVFSPDGATLASASQDGTARLWDVATHRQLGLPLTEPDLDAVSVSFGPDGRTLAVASTGGWIRLWNVALPTDLVSAVCAIPGRSVTSAALAHYVPEPPERICPPQRG